MAGPASGRPDLVRRIEAALEHGHVLVTGPHGIGRSSVLETVAERAQGSRRLLTLRCTRVACEVRGAGLMELLDQADVAAYADLPVAMREAIDEAGQGRSGPLAATAWLGLLSEMARERPLLVVVDDVQWADPVTEEVLGAALSAARGVGVRALASFALPTSRGRERTQSLVEEPVELRVPTLSAAQTIKLLQDRGVEMALAQRIYADTGGVPGLALAIARALDGQLPAGAEAQLPEGLRSTLLARTTALPPQVRATLSLAALVGEADVPTLVRAGRADAERDLQLAQQAGLVTIEADRARFVPQALRALLADEVEASERTVLHRRLAAVALHDCDRLRHEALADPGLDARRAAALAGAAQRLATSGRSADAAELALLAADRAGPELTGQRLDWLVLAVEQAVLASRSDLAGRASDRLARSDAPRAARIRTRLALLELATRCNIDIDQVLGAALLEAGDDPTLLVLVLLQRARARLVGAAVRHAREDAARAAELAASTGDDALLASALTIEAYAARTLGDPAWSEILDRASGLEAPSVPGQVHTSAEFIAARFALHDDDLDCAWQRFSGLLSRVEEPPGADTVHVLRSLTEVAARLGRGGRAVDLGRRALEITSTLGLDAAAGWYAATVAELAGGDLSDALRMAGRGVELAEAGEDLRYLRRHLLLRAQALALSGEHAAARTDLMGIQQLDEAEGLADPSQVRWHAELVSAQVATGHHDDARDLLAWSRSLVASGGVAHRGVSAQLDRSEAELCAATGELAQAAVLAAASSAAFASLGQPVEQARALLVSASVARRRRHLSEHRACLAAAGELLTSGEVGPWRALLPQTPPDEAALGAGAELTATETRIAAAVVAGGSNREIAGLLHLSVKTVEANLTRIFRKVGVGSRTQLVARLSDEALPR
ncbi:MAG: AAA family ATPase [Micrococcales bacterium]|nr:AAA family ATPase [Micrococcales bacterium]